MGLVRYLVLAVNRLLLTLRRCVDGDATPTPSTPIAANFGNSAPRHQAETFNELATSIYSQSEAEDNPSTSSSEPDIPGKHHMNATFAPN